MDAMGGGDGGMIAEMAGRLFGDLAARRGEGFEAIWRPVEEAGFASLLIGEERGGFGGGWQEMFLVQRLAGYHALAAPVGETAPGGAFAGWHGRAWWGGVGHDRGRMRG